jgi:hypothetical protein
MSDSAQRNQLPIDVEDSFTAILAEGTSYTFETRRGKEEFIIGGSTVVTIDLALKLLREMVEWKSLPANPLPISISELQELEKTIKKLNALEAASGILKELTPEQSRIFDEAIKRSPLFK